MHQEALLIAISAALAKPAPSRISVRVFPPHPVLTEAQISSLLIAALSKAISKGGSRAV